MDLIKLLIYVYIAFFVLAGINHFLNPHMILGVLSILEAGLSFNKIPHQSGGVTVANNYMLKMIKKINKSTSL